MSSMMRVTAFAAALATLAATAQNGFGAGAMAIGNCAAYGYAFDYKQPAQAKAAALTKCKGAECKVVATFQETCAAFAVDMRQTCGPHGYATANRLGVAQNTALRECYKFGGKDCVVRAWACDAKG